MSIPVTIGMPVFNGESRLGPAIESAVNQTYDNLEILISDNASTDATAEIAQGWASRDPRIRYVRQELNIGGARNFEWVLDNATSKYFLYAAHDDLRSPDYVAKLLEAMLRKPQATLSVAKCIRIEADGSVRSEYDIPEDMINNALDAETLMKVARSWWVYGLWDTHALRQGTQLSAQFGHGWGAEYIAMLPSFLERAVAASNDAIFYQGMDGLASLSTEPANPRAQWRIYRDFISACEQINGGPHPYFRTYAQHRVGGPRQIRKMLQRKLFAGRYLKRRSV